MPLRPMPTDTPSIVPRSRRAAVVGLPTDERPKRYLITFKDGKSLPEPAYYDGPGTFVLGAPVLVQMEPALNRWVITSIAPFERVAQTPLQIRVPLGDRLDGWYDDELYVVCSDIFGPDYSDNFNTSTYTVPAGGTDVRALIVDNGGNSPYVPVSSAGLKPSGYYAISFRVSALNANLTYKVRLSLYDFYNETELEEILVTDPMTALGHIQVGKQFTPSVAYSGTGFDYQGLVLRAEVLVSNADGGATHDIEFLFDADTYLDFPGSADMCPGDTQGVSVYYESGTPFWVGDRMVLAFMAGCVFYVFANTTPESDPDAGQPGYLPLRTWYLEDCLPLEPAWVLDFNSIDIRQRMVNGVIHTVLSTIGTDSHGTGDAYNNGDPWVPSDNLHSQRLEYFRWSLGATILHEVIERAWGLYDIDLGIEVLSDGRVRVLAARDEFSGVVPGESGFLMTFGTGHIRCWTRDGGGGWVVITADGEADSDIDEASTLRLQGTCLGASDAVWFVYTTSGGIDTTPILLKARRIQSDGTLDAAVSIASSADAAPHGCATPFSSLRTNTNMSTNDSNTNIVGGGSPVAVAGTVYCAYANNDKATLAFDGVDHGSGTSIVSWDDNGAPSVNSPVEGAPNPAPGSGRWNSIMDNWHNRRLFYDPFNDVIHLFNSQVTSWPGSATFNDDQRHSEGYIRDNYDDWSHDDHVVDFPTNGASQTNDLQPTGVCSGVSVYDKEGVPTAAFLLADRSFDIGAQVFSQYRYMEYVLP